MQSGLRTFLLIFPSLIFIPAGYFLAEAVSSPILCVLETFALLRILHYCLFDFGRGMVGGANILLSAADRINGKGIDFILYLCVDWISY